MAVLKFEKMQGSGNDFIMIDNRSGAVADRDKAALVRRLCPRAVAVGADGAIFIENDPELDFKWDFYNSDGSRAEMCGNGSRCAAVFAAKIGAAGARMAFRTLAGAIRAELTAGGARVQLTDCVPPRELRGVEACGKRLDLFFVNTGVPHAVVPVTDLDAVDVQALGAALRRHSQFAPAGTNVNFMCAAGDSVIAMRTYERGVEGETLACGTGAVACSIVAGELYGAACPVTVRTRSGILLKISYARGGEQVTDVFLDGPVAQVYRAELDL